MEPSTNSQVYPHASMNQKDIAMFHAQLAKGEDKLVKRLGMAVADKWGAIPLFVQDEILDQACEVEVWPTGPDVREALKSFLERDPTTSSQTKYAIFSTRPTYWKAL